MKPLYKILIIVGGIVIVALGIYLGWRKLTAGPPAAPSGGSNLPLSAGGQNQTSNKTTSSAALPANKITIKKLSDGPVFDFWTVAATREIYYLTPEGKVMAGKDGPDLEISTQTLNALNDIQVAPGDKKILAAFNAPSSPQWGIFDLLDKVWRPLPSNVSNAAWGVNDTKLIALVQNDGLLNLAWMDLSKNPPTYQVLIKDFRLQDVKFTVLSDQKIIITEKPSASWSGRVWQFDAKNLTLNLLENPANGLVINWSKDKSLAFQFASPDKFLVLSGDMKSSLSNILETLPSKCATAASSTVYCFVPQNFPTNLALPDDYFQKRFYSIDNLVVLSLASGDVSNILSSGTADFPAIDAENPQILNGNIYFINRYDNYLYELQGID